MGADQEEGTMGVPGWWSSWRALAVAVAAACLVMHVAARVADALWWRPRRLEAHFAQQGVRGPPYRFLVGCVREMVALMAEATAKPMSPPTSHDALPRVLAFYHYWRKIYGPTFLIWFGPTPRLTVAEPELVREIFLTRAEAFDRYEAHPVVRQLEGDGLVSLHGDKWALHRRVLTPAFYADNLNRLVPHVGRSVAALAERWRAMACASGGEVEVDVAEWFQAVAEETITRATFGRSYDSGRVVFRMQGHLMAFASEAFRKVLVPGYRYVCQTRSKPKPPLGDWPFRQFFSSLLREFDSQVLADQDEPDVVGSGQGDQARPRPAHRPAQRRRRRGGRNRDQGQGQRLPGFAGAHDQCWRQEGAGHASRGHGRGVQDVLLRRQADDDQPAHLGDRAPRHAPGLAGPRPPGGPRRLRRRRAPLQGAPPQAENAGDDPERDAEAVPAGRRHHPPGKGRRQPRRPNNPAGHGAAHPDHGDPPRRQVLGPRRHAVQPGPVRRRRGPGGEAPAGLHTVRARVSDVHRPEPGPPRGQAHRGDPAPALRVQALAQVRARANGPDAALPAVRRSPDLPALFISAVRFGLAKQQHSRD